MKIQKTESFWYFLKKRTFWFLFFPFFPKLKSICPFSGLTYVMVSDFSILSGSSSHVILCDSGTQNGIQYFSLFLKLKNFFKTFYFVMGYNQSTILW